MKKEKDKEKDNHLRVKKSSWHWWSLAPEIRHNETEHLGFVWTVVESDVALSAGKRKAINKTIDKARAL